MRIAPLLIARPLLVAAALLLAAAAPPTRSAGVPVPLQPQPGTPLDAIARGLAAQDLAAARRGGQQPLLLVGSARLGAASDRAAVFVQLQSPRECGSAGCSTSVYAWIKGAWKKVLDGASGRLAVAPARTRGMADLLAGDERYVWTGAEYQDSRPAPAVDLRPRSPRRPGH